MDGESLLNKDSESPARKSGDKPQKSAEVEEGSFTISQQIPLINNPISCTQTVVAEGKKKRKLIENKPIKRKKLVSGLLIFYVKTS